MTANEFLTFSHSQPSHVFHDFTVFKQSIMMYLKAFLKALTATIMQDRQKCGKPIIKHYN